MHVRPNKKIPHFYFQGLGQGTVPENKSGVSYARWAVYVHWPSNGRRIGFANVQCLTIHAPYGPFMRHAPTGWFCIVIETNYNPMCNTTPPSLGWGPPPHATSQIICRIITNTDEQAIRNTNRCRGRHAQCKPAANTTIAQTDQPTIMDIHAYE